MIDELLSDQGGELLKSLTGAGLSGGEAESFLPGAVGKIVEAVSGGGLDLGALLGVGGGDVGDLLSKIDLGALAGETGVDEGKARGGLEALIPIVLSLLQDKAGGAGGLGDLLGGGKEGGGLGGLGKIAGKLFGN
jgi:hypothetical protein